MNKDWRINLIKCPQIGPYGKFSLVKEVYVGNQPCERGFIIPDSVSPTSGEDVIGEMTHHVTSGFIIVCFLYYSGKRCSRESAVKTFTCINDDSKKSVGWNAFLSSSNERREESGLPGIVLYHYIITGMV